MAHKNPWSSVSFEILRIYFTYVELLQTKTPLNHLWLPFEHKLQYEANMKVFLGNNGAILWKRKINRHHWGFGWAGLSRPVDRGKLHWGFLSLSPQGVGLCVLANSPQICLSQIYFSLSVACLLILFSYRVKVLYQVE